MDVRSQWLSHRSLFFEIGRFVIVGIICFAIDAGTLALFKQVVFSGSGSALLLAVATAIGFAAGVTANYILSLFLVFRRPDQRARGRGKRAMIVFLVGSIIGLGLTELIMYLGTSITGRTGLMYLIVKVIATVVVMAWNYITRKLWIFH